MPNIWGKICKILKIILYICVHRGLRSPFEPNTTTKKQITMLKKTLLLLTMLAMCVPVIAEMATPDETLVYKQTEQRDLELHIFYPNDKKEGKDRPVVVSFFGGGWSGGDPKQFFDQSEFYASLGVVGISVDYRVKGRDNTTPFEAVMDAKSAVRWVRKNSKKLGVDPNKIVTSGGSAGGHLAACTAIIEGVEDDKKTKVSSLPNAAILFNPVVNTTKDGYGAKDLKGEETTLSPLHQLREGVVPMLVMHGTQDTTVPYQNAVDFAREMRAKGNDCTLISAFGENHGFFNSPNFRAACGERNFKRAMREATIFLAKLGYISEDLIPQRVPIRVACAGNSITFGARVDDREHNSYPAVLQRLLGDDYEVQNFGKSGATLMMKANIPYIDTKEYAAMKAFEPDVVIVKLGTNDSKSKNWEPYGENFSGDFLTLVKAIRKSDVRTPQLFVCSPMPAFTPSDAENINSAIIANEIYPQVKAAAKECRAAGFIDLHKYFEGQSEIFPDLIHPNAAGAKEMATYIYREIAAERIVTR